MGEIPYKFVVEDDREGVEPWSPGSPPKLSQRVFRDVFPRRGG